MRCLISDNIAAGGEKVQELPRGHMRTCVKIIYQIGESKNLQTQSGFKDKQNGPVDFLLAVQVCNTNADDNPAGGNRKTSRLIRTRTDSHTHKNSSLISVLK
jgi:hypothetical protein